MRPTIDKHEHGFKIKLLLFVLIFIFFGCISASIIFGLNRQPSLSPPIAKPTINNQNNKYASVGIIIDNLDLSQKIINIRPYYRLTTEVQNELNNNQQNWTINLWSGTQQANKPELPLNGQGTSATVAVTNSPFWGPPIPDQSNLTISLGIPVSGDTRMFPFDSYRFEIEAYEQNPKAVNLVYPPFAYYIYNNLENYKVTPKAESNGLVAVTLSRDTISEIVSILLLVFLYVISALVTYGLFVKRLMQNDIGTIISVVALLIVIPSIRITVVPSQIQVWTLFDEALIIPTVVLICATGKLIFTQIRQT